ncbi:MAG: DUF4389 domain-containing protein, partial [Acidimicrobiales bacterium]
MTVFFRALLAVPQLFVVYFVGLAAGVVAYVAWFAVLITGRWPVGMRRFFVGYQRWNMRLTAYLYLLVDDYPPFSLTWTGRARGDHSTARLSGTAAMTAVSTLRPSVPARSRLVAAATNPSTSTIRDRP